MMRRVTSRPRLVSDADKDFQNATVEVDVDSDVVDEFSSLAFEDGGYGLHSFDGDGIGDDQHQHQGHHQHHRHENTHSHMTCVAKSPTSTYVATTSDTDDEDDDEDLSDYLPCYDDFATRPPSMADLQASTSITTNSNDMEAVFTADASRSSHPMSDDDGMDIIPSEEDEDDEDEKPSSASSAFSFELLSMSTKRKRFSQHYMTPKSSYASLTNLTMAGLSSHQLSMMAHSTSCAQGSTSMKQPSSSPSSASAISCMGLMTSLPEENLLSIASHLPLKDVRAFTMTCHSIRASLVASQGATKVIWTTAMSQAFPSVFAAARDDNDDDNNGLDNQIIRATEGYEYNDDGKKLSSYSSSSSSEAVVVSFVDEYQLPIPALLLGDNDNTSLLEHNDASCGKANHNHNPNLPLLTGLLPSRYPRAIDTKTLSYLPRLFGERAPRKFRSGIVEMEIEITDDHCHGKNKNDLLGNNDDGEKSSAEESSVVTPAGQVDVPKRSISVPVVQFTGNVGIGDRCIRSDQPFPPNPSKVSLAAESAPSSSSCTCSDHSSTCDSCSSSASSSVSSGFGRGLSSWMKRHSHRRSSSEKKKRNSISSSLSHRSIGDETTQTVASGTTTRSQSRAAAFRTNSSLSSTASSFNHGVYIADNHPLSNTPIVTKHLPDTAAASTSMPRQDSPLFPFLSSLSHNCTSSPTLSTNDNSTMRNSSFYLDQRRGSADSNEDRANDSSGLLNNNNSHNNYGIMIKQDIVSKCKQCLGKFRGTAGNLKYPGDNSDDGEALRPFVIPTVISDTRNGDTITGIGVEQQQQCHHLVVDVTPRLVAYFEVTIVKEGQVVTSLQNNENTPTNRRNAHWMNLIDNRRNEQRQQRPPGPQIVNIPQRMVMPPIFPALPHGAGAADQERMRGLQGDALVLLRELLELDQLMQLMRELRPAPPAAEAAVDLPPRFNAPPQQRNDGNDGNDNGNGNNGRPPRHECVAIGLSTGKFNPHDKMPGWDHESFGYHGDDGGTFHGRGDILHHYGPPFGPGDTVGCGLEYSTGKIFFTKNGEFLGYAFDGEGGVTREVVEGGLYPTVGVDTECPIFMNFGERPFGFDLRGFAASVTTEGGHDD